MINPPAGFWGTAAYRAERVFVSDIATDPLWADCSELALSHDLRACSSTPMLSSVGAVLGALDIYSRQPRQVTPRERSITDQFSHLASIVVERKRAEDALRKSQTFLAEGQRISHTGSWAWNVSKEKFVWSEEHCRIFGFGTDQPETTWPAFFERVHPDDLAMVQAVLDDAVRRSSEFSLEYRINLPDGTTKHVHSKGRPVRGSLRKSRSSLGQSSTSRTGIRPMPHWKMRSRESRLRKTDSGRSLTPCPHWLGLLPKTE